MRSSLIWEANFSIESSSRCPIFSLCFKVDYSQLIVAVANDLFFLDPNSGSIIEKRRPHQAPIYCVRCSPDGIFFASSSADGFVVISRSINNDAFVRYGAPVATKSLCWSPNKQMLVSCSIQEFQVWHPDDTRAARYKVDAPIVSCSFSPTGQTFLLSFENGDVFVYDPSKLPNVVQTFHFTFPVTSVSYAMFNDTEYIIATDLNRHVSLFKASDKTLVGKNSLTFEALSSVFVDGFFLLSGVSGRICLLTSGLSFLGEVESNGDFIWDTSINNKGELAIARRDGFVELRRIEFGLTFAIYRSTIAYRTNANQITVRDIMDEKKTNRDLTFLKIINSVQMNSNKILIHFKDSLILLDNKTFEKISEIPGDFSDCEFALNDTVIIYSRKKELKFIDKTGKLLSCFIFQSEIKCISESTEGVIVGCEDGSISFIVNEKSHLLISHSSSIEWIQRKENKIAAIDKDYRCYIYNSFDSSILHMIEYARSFAFNDRIPELYASSNNYILKVYYKDCKPVVHYIEGILLAFVKNLLIVSNHGAIEIIPANLPFEELIKRDMWDDINKLIISLLPSHSIPLELSKDGINNYFGRYSNNADQISQDIREKLLDECVRLRSFDLAPLLIEKTDKSKLFLFSEILPNTPEAIQVLDQEKDVNYGKKAKILEESGDNQKALDAYAQNNDWDSVIRLSSTDSNLARQMADFNLPKKYSSDVAKILLNFGFGDSAVRVLTTSHDFSNLAKAYVYLGQWIDAISLTRLSPSVSPIVYPKMSQLLLESNLYFESLVCLFVVSDNDVRAEAIQKMMKCASSGTFSFNQLKYINLMNAFNNPENYWTILELSYVYICIDRIKSFSLFLPMNQDDAIELFYMCHFVCAKYKMIPIEGIDITDIIIHFLFASSILGLKRWVAFSLKELMQLDFNENQRRIIQLSALMSKELQPCQEINDMKCPKCNAGIFTSGKMPLLVCGTCGMKIAFSAFSGRPLPLVNISYEGKSNPTTLIQIEPDPNESIPELRNEFISDEFLEKTPAEMFVIQKIKKKAGVHDQLWLNPTFSSFHICPICGSIMDEIDYEKSFMEFDYCPICHGNEAESESNPILAALRSFQAESPILY